MRLERVDISSSINCQDSILCQGTRFLYQLYSFQNSSLLFGGKQHRNSSSRELFGKSTPLMSSVFMMVYQCYFQCWRGSVGMKLQKSICPLQRMGCLQGERRTHSLHSPCFPAESLADAAELPWIFCARAENHCFPVSANDLWACSELGVERWW